MINKNLKEQINKFVKEENFEKWLDRPNALMGMRVPRELILNKQEEVIWEALKLARKGDV